MRSRNQFCPQRADGYTKGIEWVLPAIIINPCVPSDIIYRLRTGSDHVRKFGARHIDTREEAIDPSVQLEFGRLVASGPVL
jgi:hypothetical protein